MSLAALSEALRSGQAGALADVDAGLPDPGDAAVAVGCNVDEARIAVSGADRADFLHRLLTADLAALPDDTGRRSLLLDNRGHIVADLEVWGGAEEWSLAGHPDVADRVVEELRRFVLRADVRLERVPQVSLVVAGAGAEALLASMGVEIPGPGHGIGAAIAGAAVRAEWPSRAAWSRQLVVPGASEAAAVLEALTDAEPAIAPLGALARSRLRVLAQEPAVGHELTGREFPQEARLESAVSFDKGCYLGQETVARIHYRGHVNRLLCGLRFTDRAEVGAALEADGREVGQVTSVAATAEADFGLAYVRREHAGEGSRLDIVGRPGVAAEVLPPAPR